jgi:MFS family permease
MAGLRSLLADTTPLRTPAFRRLWLANIVTVIGAQLTVVAVPAQIYALTQSSAWVGLTGLFGLVPLVVFGLWGGALADHFDRRSLLLVTTAGIILTSAAFWLQAVLGNTNVWLLLVVFAAQQAFFAVNQPTRTALLGMLIPILGISWLYLIDTVTLLATLVAVLALPALPVHNRIGSPGLRSVVDGFRYLAGHTVLLLSFGVDLIAMVLGMPRALFPEIAHLNFGGPPEGGLELAWLFAGIPLGSLLGGVLSGWVSRVRRQGRAVVVAVGIWGLAVAGFGVAAALAPQLRGMLAVALVMLAIGGAADMASAAFRQAMLLGAADDAVRGRLQGVFIVVVAGGPRLADVLHGYAGAAMGAAWASALGGALVVLAMLVVALTVPAFWRYRLP